MFWITGILQFTHSSGPWNINTVAYNVTLFVFSELEEMLISHVIIDMDSGHGNEFLIIPNINERKKLASSRRQKKLLSKSESPTVISIQMTRWRCLEFEPESKWFGRNWLSIFILSRPDGNPCIQELVLEMFEGKKYFFIIIFLLWAGILEF